ncbi:hypothetical protein Dimus_007156 [Dionaea muscipula]
MQTTKTRSVSLEVPQKISPTTPRAARQLKAPGSDSDTVSSPNSCGRMPKNRSPKVTERVSPRSTTTEKKRTGRISELESQLALLQDELKKVKEQLISTETQKRQAQQEADETKGHLTTMSVQLEESQQQLLELSASEEARVKELRRISHDRDRAWQSELEAIHRQHSMDSAALASARNEIQKLKKQLELVADSEIKQSRHAESAYAEIHSLRVELSETLVLLEKMKHQLNDSKESEARALKVASEAQKQLEAVKATAETLRSDGLMAMEAYDSVAFELEQSNAQASSLEMLVNKLQADLGNNSTNPSADGDKADAKNQEREKVCAEIESLEVEVGHLKSTLEASEIRYQREYIRSTLEIRDAYAEVERAKTESALREAQLKEDLRNANSAIKELKSELMCKMNKSMTGLMESEPKVEHGKLETDLKDLKASLLDKETQLQNIIEENEILNMQIKEGEFDRSKSSEEAATLAKVSEQEVLIKLWYVTAEADKSSWKAAQIAEQLDAAQTANTKLEAELRRLKVQSDQWRKAAEAAAAMLSPERNSEYIDRSVSLDNSSYLTYGAKMDSPLSDEMDGDSPKKKNGNVLKKIGVFLKKGQKEKHHM